ncbi:hypothetical protein M9H77_30818 [Catharanthus roseus]|uniref:Uncharacterized protein n=1 Tax=Catharanthus roseus TaxID=4058 RepID=A0ACB9ZZ97_CATRO|nr:hypothetical protein M9H77_30818 [Catharanthus roseus]
MENHNSVLGRGGESEANLVLGCFFLDNCCLVHLSGPVCPCVDRVREGGTTPGATIFGITKGSNALTQESDVKKGTWKSNLTGLLLVDLPGDVLEDNNAYVDPLPGGKSVEQMSFFLENSNNICSGQPVPTKYSKRGSVWHFHQNTEGASIPITCRGVHRVDTSRGRSGNSSASTLNSEKTMRILKDHSKEVLSHSLLLQFAAILGRNRADVEVR